jgi:hypothetical protein
LRSEALYFFSAALTDEVNDVETAAAVIAANNFFLTRKPTFLFKVHTIIIYDFFTAVK